MCMLMCVFDGGMEGDGTQSIMVCDKASGRGAGGYDFQGCGVCVCWEGGGWVRGGEGACGDGKTRVAYLKHAKGTVKLAREGLLYGGGVDAHIRQALLSV